MNQEFMVDRSQSKTCTKQHEIVQEGFFHSHLLQSVESPVWAPAETKDKRVFKSWDKGIRGRLCLFIGFTQGESQFPHIFMTEVNFTAQSQALTEAGFYPLTEDREVEVLLSLRMTFQRNESQVQKVISEF